MLSLLIEHAAIRIRQSDALKDNQKSERILDSSPVLTKVRDYLSRLRYGIRPETDRLGRIRLFSRVCCKSPIHEADGLGVDPRLGTWGGGRPLKFYGEQGKKESRLKRVPVAQRSDYRRQIIGGLYPNVCVP